MEARAARGDTPLLLAAGAGDVGVVERLRNRDRLTAADVAAARCFDAIAEALKGA